MPNYYDMTAGDQQAASAGIPPAQTTGTIGATTQAGSDVQRLHKYKLPPPYFNGGYSNYNEWRFKLQAYLGLIDNEFDQILRAADVATNTVVDQHLINEVLPGTGRGNKLANLARDLHYILISICQGPAATVVRQNRYTANGCETLQPVQPTSWYKKRWLLD